MLSMKGSAGDPLLLDSVYEVNAFDDAGHPISTVQPSPPTLGAQTQAEHNGHQRCA